MNHNYFTRKLCFLNTHYCILALCIIYWYLEVIDLTYSDHTKLSKISILVLFMHVCNIKHTFLLITHGYNYQINVLTLKSVLFCFKVYFRWLFKLIMLPTWLRLSLECLQFKLHINWKYSHILKFFNVNYTYIYEYADTKNMYVRHQT